MPQRDGLSFAVRRLREARKTAPGHARANRDSWLVPPSRRSPLSTDFVLLGVARRTDCRRVSGVTGVSEDATNEPLLTHGEVLELQRAIEAGLLARDARTSGAGFADATDQELRLLEEHGALARQRFIRANLRLVGMVSRQFASRCQLGNAELFQEGCIGLPACQLPTGSSPCTSLVPTRQSCWARTARLCRY
jgi:hypothetical protein